MPDKAFHSLFSDTENTTWDTTNQVRTRARRRTAGQAAAVAGIVAVALVSGGVAMAEVRRHSVAPPVAPASASPSTPAPSTASVPSVSPTTPSAGPSSSTATPPSTVTRSSGPAATGITAGMMLRPQDVGAGYTVVAEGLGGGDWTFEFNGSLLGCPRGVKPEPVAERDRSLRKGEPQDEDSVVQHTGRYPDGEAAQYLDGIRERVSACTSSDRGSVDIAAEGFAGDDAVLVLFDHGSGSVTKLVMVREGDVLTEIYSKQVRSDADSQELGRKAAARF